MLLVIVALGVMADDRTPFLAGSAGAVVIATALTIFIPNLYPRETR
jgi:hypothetical protein